MPVEEGGAICASDHSMKANVPANRRTNLTLDEPLTFAPIEAAFVLVNELSELLKPR